MRKAFIFTTVLLAVFAIPASAVAKPSQAQVKRSKDECRAELEVAGLKNFRDLYGIGKHRSMAMHHCVKIHGKMRKHARKSHHRLAVRECEAQREADPEGFQEEYGTDESGGKNAFGKCVSEQILEDVADENNPFRIRLTAIANCRDERAADPDAFMSKYREIGRKIGDKAGQRKNGHKAGNGSRFRNNRPFTVCVRVTMRKIHDGERGDNPGEDEGGDDEGGDEGDDHGDNPPDEDEGGGEGGGPGEEPDTGDHPGGPGNWRP